MAEAIRSFIAFDLDSASVLKRLSEAQTLLTKTGGDLRVVEPENIHVTLRFLGNITPDTVERIYEEMKNMQFAPFDISIQGLGAFPDVHYPRVCWAGIRQGVDQLKNIFSQLEPRLQALGFAPETRGFSPHLTIARVRSGRNKAELAKCIHENLDYDFGLIKAACLRLKRSELTPRGPIYLTLKEVCPQE